MTDRMKRIRAIFLNGCKQYKWICIGWALLLLSVLPTRMFMFRSLGSQGFGEQMTEFATNLQVFHNPLLIIYVLIAPVISVLIIFSHLHQKNRVDLMHQLPVTRMDLLLGRGLIALASTWLPLMATGIIVYLLKGLTPEFQAALQWKYLFQWMIHGTIFLCLHTSITILIGFVTGMIPTHGFFAVIAYLFPLGIYTLLLGNLSLLAQTYYFSFYVTDRFSWWMPIVRISLQDGFPVVQELVYLLLSILFFFGSYWLYRMRDLEAAGNVIAFPKFNRVFKYGMGFCFLLVMGPFFFLLSNNNPLWLYFGYGFGGLFGFFLAEVLIQKSFHVWKQWKSFLVFILISAGLIVGMHMDLLGIEKWQPSAESIVDFSLATYDRYYSQNDEDEYPALSDSLKEKTLTIQKEMMAANLPEGTQDAETIYCTYYLGEKGISKRLYTLDDRFLNASYRAYLADPEVMLQNFPVLNMEPAQVATLRLSSGLMSGRVITLTSPSEIRMLTEAIQQDIHGLQGGTYWNYLPSDERNTEFAYAHFLDQDGQTILDMPLRNQFEETVAQLIAMDRMERLVMTLDEVESIHLASPNDNKQDKVIDDPKIIEELITFMNNTGDRYWRPTDYEIVVYFVDRSIGTLYYPIDANELPRSLRY